MRFIRTVFDFFSFDSDLFFLSPARTHAHVASSLLGISVELFFLVLLFYFFFATRLE